MPFHLTLSAWNISEEKIVIEKLEKINFSRIKIKVSNIEIMNGSEDSQVLYLAIEDNYELKKLQKEIFDAMPSEKYNPTKFKFHMTIHIDKDYKKIKKILENNLQDLELSIESFGLFEIYPAHLIKRFVYF